MALKHWKKISEEVLASNPWSEYCVDTFEIPNGKSGQYFYLRTSGGSAVIPIMEDGRILLLKQYRFLNDSESWEFPIGNLRTKNADGSVTIHEPEETANRELKEEGGLVGDLTYLSQVYPTPSFLKESVYIYLARNCRRVGTEWEETEEFEERLVTSLELDEMVLTGKITAAVPLAAWALARHHFFP